MKAAAKKQLLPNELVRMWSRQLVEAVAHLHSVNQMAHLDLKPDNIVIKDDLSLALIDFAHA
jgi:serine/threonine protein kinase